VANTSGGSSSIHLLVPFSSYIFPAKQDSVRYRFSLNLLNSEKQNLYQDFLEARINKRQIVGGAAQVFSFDKVLIPGTYELIVTMLNSDLGDRKEKQLAFTVPDSSTSAVTNMVIARNNNFNFSPASYSQLSPDLLACQYLLDTNAPCDSIILKVQYADRDSLVRIPRKSGMEFDILPLVQAGTIRNIEVRYYDRNIISPSGVSLYRSYDTYRQRFTSEEQLQQLKFIAGQSEWKAIRKLADKDIESAIEYFWERHDNSPTSFRNDLRDLFYERVFKADELFTIHKKMPGWRSDRGRIYIQMGPPDEIVSEPFPLGQSPYIIWYYYDLNQIYKFSDKRGFGDYKIEVGYDEN
jgi:GWxTD domain-containing protein